MARRQKGQGEKGERPQPSFEAALARLEEIAARLESGELPLEEAIALAEEGRQLSETCERQLTEAEGKIEQLVERMGAVEAEPLAAATEEAGGEEA
jgi:exodeoxyribonuclease VII small subunit